MSPECRKPRLIPVLDVMNGQVVRAIGGRRHAYQPIVSQLTRSTEPAEVASALIAAAGASELYVADLDVLSGSDSIQKVVRDLIEKSRVRIWLDAGFGPARSVHDLADLPCCQPVIGFETCTRPDLLEANLEAATGERVAFSVDLRAGELLGNWRAWGLRDGRDVTGLVRQVTGVGCQRLIVLDLAHVGAGRGSGTEELLRAIRSEFPGVELMAGGGVHSWADVEHLGELGVDAVLLASALHDGTIQRPRPGSVGHEDASFASSSPTRR